MSIVKEGKSKEEIIEIINCDGFYSLGIKEIDILVDRYYKPVPFELNEFIEYAHRILGLQKQMFASGELK